MFPRWVYLVAVIWFVLAVGAFSFTWSKCGAKTLLLGNGGFTAAFIGMCD